jgi:nucleotide-binding universal stress UspA family protein
MKLNNIVLVPTDFSAACANAASHAIKIAQIAKFKVVLFHVINKESSANFAGEKDINLAVENKLKQMVADLKSQAPDTEVDYMYQEGSIFDLIHEVAGEIGANIILLGTQGKKGLQHLLGSYALKVITKAKVPTLVVQKRPYSGYHNLMLPINSFTEARQTVNISIALARLFKSTIHLFKEVVSDAGEMSRIEIITRQITDAFSKANIPYNLIVSNKPGESAKELIDVAVQKSMDAIIIVTEPQIGSTYFSLGSWNEKILFNEAQIPVICINPIELGQVFFDF